MSVPPPQAEERPEKTVETEKVMNIKNMTAVLLCIALTGCGTAAQTGEETAMGEGTSPIQQESVQAGSGAQVTLVDNGGQTVLTGEGAEAGQVIVSGGSTKTAAFSARIDAHDLYMKLNSVQPGGAEVTEEVEICGNILHDVYKSAEGVVTSELFIVDGGIWSITNEGSDVPMYVGFDNNYDAHIRECVFHNINVADAGAVEAVDNNTETVKDQAGNVEFTYVYSDDGMLVSYDGCGAHYEVAEFREGIGEVKLPENLKAAIEERDNSVY